MAVRVPGAHACQAGLGQCDHHLRKLLEGGESRPDSGVWDVHIHTRLPVLLRWAELSPLGLTSPGLYSFQSSLSWVVGGRGGSSSLGVSPPPPARAWLPRRWRPEAENWHPSPMMSSPSEQPLRSLLASLLLCLP